MKKKLATRIIAFVCAMFGFGILAYVFSPIIAYEITAPKYTTYLSPIPDGQAGQTFANVDYTKASNWFAGDNPAHFENPDISFYTLSIPRLRINEATVAIGGEDLAKSLIQYPGTAVPGRPGNAVIFGHSILPQFFDPKNYISIFSTLQNLRNGDEILINYDGIALKYRVEDEFEVLPTDIQILEQNPSDSFLTLVTCSPPGHPGRPRRLIIRARVVPV